jgi:hypothetical protein
MDEEPSKAAIAQRATPRRTLRAMGVLLLLCVLLGLKFAIDFLFVVGTAWDTVPAHVEYAILAVVFGLLIVSGTAAVQLLRCSTNAYRWLAGAMLLEATYFATASGMIWGPSLALATTLAVLGTPLIPQFAVLAPFWMPGVAEAATLQLQATADTTGTPAVPAPRVERFRDWLYAAAGFYITDMLCTMIIVLLCRHVPPSDWPALLMPPILVVSTIQVFRGTRQRRRAKIQRTQSARLSRGLCPICSYTLAGLPDDRCPECGTGFDRDRVGRG